MCEEQNEWDWAPLCYNRVLRSGIHSKVCTERGNQIHVLHCWAVETRVHGGEQREASDSLWESWGGENTLWHVLHCCHRMTDKCSLGGLDFGSWFRKRQSPSWPEGRKAGVWVVWSQRVCSQIAERRHKTTGATPSDLLLPMRLYLLESVYTTFLNSTTSQRHSVQTDEPMRCIHTLTAIPVRYLSSLGWSWVVSEGLEAHWSILTQLLGYPQINPKGLGWASCVKYEIFHN